jgi:hypothetical protein
MLKQLRKREQNNTKVTNIELGNQVRHTSRLLRAKGRLVISESQDDIAMAPQTNAIMPGIPCKLKMPQVSMNPKAFN